MEPIDELRRRWVGRIVNLHVRGWRGHPAMMIVDVEELTEPDRGGVRVWFWARYAS